MRLILWIVKHRFILSASQRADKLGDQESETGRDRPRQINS